MEVRPTPRQIANGLLKGISPPRPLFLPIVFSLGAKVENIPLAGYQANPTKISNALRQMQSHLRLDGVSCYFDPFLELEALGAKVEHREELEPGLVHWPGPIQPGAIPESLCSPDEAGQHGRIRVATEVLRRMNALPIRDFLLMAGVSGPMTLATRIAQCEGNEGLRFEDVPTSVQDYAASVVTQTATSFLEAGADLIIIQEQILPAFSPQSCEAWANLLAPTINVIRFYEALPVLQLSPILSVFQNWDAIVQHRWDCVVSVPLELLASREAGGSPPRNDVTIGISLSQETFGPEGSDGEEILPILKPVVSRLRPALLTTSGDVPAMTEMKRLVKILGEVPRAF
jgi:uroporphyrinogen decarboxylase-like protein